MDNFEIRLSGTGGQGLQLSADILSEALVHEGAKIARSQSYEPTSRGGLSRSDLVVGADGVDYPLATALDFLLILDASAAHASDTLIKPDATVLVDAQRMPEPPGGPFTLLSLPLCETARALGNLRVANMVALGVFAGLGGICALESLQETIRSNSPPRFHDLNFEALKAGYALVAPAEGGSIDQPGVQLNPR
jgi:2-oxoglutarate ferredoxin oxidoreductase subunit gamma